MRRSSVLDAFKPDAVLLDIGMPGMDGYEVARRIRATSAHRDVLLIALTGWGQEHDHRRSRAAGFDHHLVKPPDIDKLRDLLTAHLHATAERRLGERSHRPRTRDPQDGTAEPRLSRSHR